MEIPIKTGKFEINGTKFNLPDGWIQRHPLIKGESALDFWKGNDPHIRIEQLDKEKYESNYAEESTDSINYKIMKETILISGVEVKILRVTDKRTEDILDSYFFQKNEKYFEILSWDYTTQASARIDIDNAVNEIVTTLN